MSEAYLGEQALIALNIGYTDTVFSRAAITYIAARAVTQDRFSFFYTEPRLDDQQFQAIRDTTPLINVGFRDLIQLKNPHKLDQRDGVLAFFEWLLDPIRRGRILFMSTPDELRFFRGMVLNKLQLPINPDYFNGIDLMSLALVTILSKRPKNIPLTPDGTNPINLSTAFALAGHDNPFDKPGQTGLGLVTYMGEVAHGLIHSRPAKIEPFFDDLIQELSLMNIMVNIYRNDLMKGKYEKERPVLTGLLV